MTRILSNIAKATPEPEKKKKKRKPRREEGTWNQSKAELIHDTHSTAGEGLTLSDLSGHTSIPPPASRQRAIAKSKIPHHRPAVRWLVARRKRASVRHNPARTLRRSNSTQNDPAGSAHIRVIVLGRRVRADYAVIAIPVQSNECAGR